MGANKQSRFHGKDPRYKNIERTTLADIQRRVEDRWEREADDFLAERHATSFSEAERPARGYIASHIPKQDPILTEAVKAYLQQRKPSNTENATVSDHAPERVRLEAPDYVTGNMQVAPSSHDLLLQMLIEKKITLDFFHAGRRWQWYQESAVLQPCVSMDWSHESPSPYQHTELSERQWEALRRRRQFTQHSGIKATALLDFLLTADRGRHDLMELTGLSGKKIEAMLLTLIDALCGCFG